MAGTAGEGHDACVPVVVAWSGGRDSALLVQRIRADAHYDIVALVTTVTAAYDRISIHGVRRNILHAQAESLGLPLVEAFLPSPATNAVYESAFAGALEAVRTAHPDMHTIAFGDLFLEDVRAYRERTLPPLGWEPIFPLWGEPTDRLAHRFIADGFHAVLCCVDTVQLDPAYAGREFDERLLRALPPGVDPCGERGEFHTCVYGGPIFERALTLERGERVLRDERFEYCDLTLSAFDRP